MEGGFEYAAAVGEEELQRVTRVEEEGEEELWQEQGDDERERR